MCFRHIPSNSYTRILRLSHILFARSFQPLDVLKSAFAFSWHFLVSHKGSSSLWQKKLINCLMLKCFYLTHCTNWIYLQRHWISILAKILENPRLSQYYQCLILKSESLVFTRGERLPYSKPVSVLSIVLDRIHCPLNLQTAFFQF